jgi:hypothetical protein
MSAEPEHFELKLTPEQQALIRRHSGQQAQILEHTLNSGNNAEGVGRALQFRWRLSESSGIPRQTWDKDDDAPSES